MQKISIYQVFTRLFGNTLSLGEPYGDAAENGVGKMNDFSPKALQEIKDLGISHIWYTGLIEHARCAGNPDLGIPAGHPKVIKGRAGSPYAISDYYDINPDLAVNPARRMEEFEALVQRTHTADLQVIIDFVPNHVAREYHSDQKPETDFGLHDDTTLAFSHRNDFYYLPGESLQLPEEAGTLLETDRVAPFRENPAKATGNDRFSARPEINDWYETVKLNYGIDYLNGQSRHFEPRPPLWDKMLAILRFWAEKGVDGFRCDMVEMVPVEFWAYAIAEVKKRFPHIRFYAEVYNPALYAAYIRQGGFDYLYDKVGLYDTVKNILCHQQPASAITHCWQQLGGLDAHMLRFLENHDEQRFASPYFTGDTQLAVPAMMVSAYLHQGPIMTYFGQELGEPAAGENGFSGDDGRTTIFDYYHVPELQKWVNKGRFDGGLLSEEQQGLRAAYQKILRFAVEEEAIAEGAFYDLMWVNTFEQEAQQRDIYAFLRYTPTQRLLITVNFSRDTNHQVVLKVPDDALEAMGLHCKDTLSLQGRLFDEREMQVDRVEWSQRGLWLLLPASSGCVLEIR